MALIAEARRLARGGFPWRRPPYEYERTRLPIDLLGGGDAIRREITQGAALSALERGWRRDVGRFARLRRPYLLYR